MRFDVVGLARPRTPRDDALRVGAKHGDGVNDGCNHVAEQQDQAWQDTLHVRIHGVPALRRTAS